ncbi:sensor histidine kinase [Caulobacter sp. KR2-114]|uniref:sensor histidine kinase PhyK n=1 Tax=Caulobacter sp. KR2-114 TaxID=3400912 RepID=UPI003C0C7EA0
MKAADAVAPVADHDAGRSPPAAAAPPAAPAVSHPARRWLAVSIRWRLGLALALALLPVLLLSGFQSWLDFDRESHAQRDMLAAAAERSAATARARIEAADVLLETLAPGSVGFQCAQRLAEVRGRIPGYANLIRFDSIGRVACAAATAPADPTRRDRPWFHSLAGGQPVVVASDPGVGYADEPSVLAAVRAENASGGFDGALVAVITLASLRPETADRSLPEGSEVALTDSQGRYLSATTPAAFPPGLGTGHLTGAGHASLWFGHDRQGSDRVFSAAPLVGNDVYVILSAPSQGLVTWAWINPLTSLALPLIAFTLSLGAVWIVAERQIIRWIAYLQRIAAIYGRGRFSIHPLKAEAAPPEIRDLAQTLDEMAQAISVRDAALRDNLAQKDDLMREIHHRVKNNLQVISSLLNMQQRSLTDPAARVAMSDTRMRIAALALIYRSLYQGADLKRVDLREFLDELLAQVLAGDTVPASPIRTELSIDPLVIDPDRLAPLALFAVEAISNARKHGVGQHGGELSVVFRVRGEQAELAISDTGAGVQQPAAPVIGQGVGRTLMTAFARQLRGEVDFTPNDRGGLTTRLLFPTPSLEPA